MDARVNKQVDLSTAKKTAKNSLIQQTWRVPPARWDLPKVVLVNVHCFSLFGEAIFLVRQPDTKKVEDLVKQAGFLVPKEDMLDVKLDFIIAMSNLKRPQVTVIFKAKQFWPMPNCNISGKDIGDKYPQKSIRTLAYNGIPQNHGLQY